MGGLGGDALLALLSSLDPTQIQADNISPLNANVAEVGHPTAIKTQGWTSEPSVHGSATESPLTPYQSTFEIKMYATLGVAESLLWSIYR